MILRLMRTHGLALVLLVSLLVLVSSVFVASQVGASLLTRERTDGSSWFEPSPAECVGWVEKVGYSLPEDLAENAEDWLLPCEKVLTFPALHGMTKSRSGLQVHFVQYETKGLIDGADAPDDGLAKRPIWLHVHGLNGNFLHGARYILAAARLGFDLVTLELSNHGTSGYDGLGTAYGCKEKDDVLAVVRELLIAESSRDLLITATSMGSMAVALAQEQLAALDVHRRIVGYAFESPIPSLRGIVSVQEIAEYIPDLFMELVFAMTAQHSGFDLDECAPIHAFGGFQRPVLIQHSRMDDFAPPELGEAVFSALPAHIPRTLQIYDAGLHSAAWNAQPQAFESDLRVFWENSLAHRSKAQ